MYVRATFKQQVHNLGVSLGCRDVHRGPMVVSPFIHVYAVLTSVVRSPHTDGMNTPRPELPLDEQPHDIDVPLGRSYA